MASNSSVTRPLHRLYGTGLRCTTVRSRRHRCRISCASPEETGWNAVELRRGSFTKCFDAGMSNEQVVDLIRSSGIHAAVVGTEYGLFFAKGEEQRRLLKVLDETCVNAVALGCDLVMCAEGFGGGTVREAGANIRAAGEICGAHNIRFAFEYRPPDEVAREGANATRALLAASEKPHAARAV